LTCTGNEMRGFPNGLTGAADGQWGQEFRLLCHCWRSSHQDFVWVKNRTGLPGDFFRPSFCCK